MTLRVNIGCGDRKLPGFVNVDLEGSADLVIDVREGLPFDDGAVDLVYSEHFLEHLSQAEGARFLRECRRVLRPEGVVRVAMPDLDYLIAKYGTVWREQSWIETSGYEWLDNRCEMLNVAMRDWGHCWLYNEEELVRLGMYAGLAPIGRFEAGQSGSEERRGLEGRPDSKLIVEFVKPSCRLPSEPLVSVLIPAYNPRYFAEALDSAFAQTYGPLEIVVCDDCPDSRVATIVSSQRTDSRIRYTRNEGAPMGAIANYLRCFAQGRGDLVKFLNDDDLLQPTCVEQMVRCMVENPGVTLVTSKRRMIDGRGSVIADDPSTVAPVASDSVVDGATAARWLLESGLNFIGEPTTALFRRADALSIRPHLLSFCGRAVAWNVDVALWLSLLMRGDLMYLADPLSDFRRHADQEQARPDAARRGEDAWRQLRFDGARFGLFGEAPLAGHASGGRGCR